MLPNELFVRLFGTHLQLQPPRILRRSSGLCACVRTRSFENGMHVSSLFCFFWPTAFLGGIAGEVDQTDFFILVPRAPSVPLQVHRHCVLLTAPHPVVPFRAWSRRLGGNGRSPRQGQRHTPSFGGGGDGGGWDGGGGAYVPRGR